MEKFIVEFPVKVGDHVWIRGSDPVEYEVLCVCSSTTSETDVWFYAGTSDRKKRCTFHDYQIGKVVFLTREEALRGGKEDG